MKKKKKKKRDSSEQSDIQHQALIYPEPEIINVCVCVYLISKEDFDSHLSSSRRNVLDCKCVVGVGDDIKVHISLSVTDHIGVTFDTDTDVT